MFGNMFGMNKDNAGAQVNELIERLKQEVNLNDLQANQVVTTLKNFLVEKYPMLQGAVDNIFGEKK